MKSYISHQLARSFGPLAYRKAKQGYNMLATRNGVTSWLGYVQPHGFYLMPFDDKNGQSEQLREKVA